jgi:hypothetical protein
METSIQGCFCDSNKSQRGYCGRWRPLSRDASATVINLKDVTVADGDLYPGMLL